MDLKQLRYFLAVVEAGGFTAAAARLGIAQPALSIAIRKLERTLDLELLHRGTRRVTPTSEGEVLAGHARALLERAEAAELQMRELRGLLKGEVRIGLPSILGSYFFPPLLMAFKHRHPGLRLSVQEAGTRSLLSMIRAGVLDLGVVTSDAELDGLETHPFLREEVVVHVGRSHPLAEVECIDFATLFEHDLVVARSGYFLREFIDRHAAALEVEPRIAFETNLIPLAETIVRQGFGITCVLRMVSEQTRDPGLVAIPFATPVHLDFSLAWQSGGYLSRADRAFLDFVREQTAWRGDGAG
ncbi:LysR family transcriptional regulator [Marichromatium gracile]|uniref:LysR family transcriptional regulator n=1 Tax=Marichromatium gracile TaxID=1048 RepID=A0ABR5VEH7_MARGR|nr:LysR family transcriptional regulator [Marichromatium gracile]KXX63964.1 LysR family transcriptional regulator [Marichromatium gracile]